MSTTLHIEIFFSMKHVYVLYRSGLLLSIDRFVWVCVCSACECALHAWSTFIVNLRAEN